MKFTFAITTSFENEKQLQEVYESIRSLQIPEYEILVIGGEKRVDEKDVTYLYFDEAQNLVGLPEKRIASYSPQIMIILY